MMNKSQQKFEPPPVTNWQEVEKVLNVPLPPDYKKLMDSKGCLTLLDGLVLVTHPLSQSLNLLEEIETAKWTFDWRQESYNLEKWPATARSGVGSLLPWGILVDQFRGYWLTSEQPPEEWKLYLGPTDYDSWLILGNSLTEFLEFMIATASGGNPSPLNIIEDKDNFMGYLMESSDEEIIKDILLPRSDYFSSIQEAQDYVATTMIDTLD